MTDKLKVVTAIREALEAGPTPGPWLVDQDKRPGMAWNRSIANADGSAWVCIMTHSGGRDTPKDKATAAYIATVNPAALTTVLAHIEETETALDAALERVKVLEAMYEARELEAHQLSEQIIALRREKEVLEADARRLDCLERQGHAYGFQDMHEGNRWLIEGPYRTVREAIDALEVKHG